MLEITIDSPSVNRTHYAVGWKITGGSGSPSHRHYVLWGSGSMSDSPAPGPIDGVRLYPSGMSSITGTFKLYGIK